MHAMVLLICHKKKIIKNVMDVHCILNAIFNGKQTRRESSMLTKIGVKQTIRTTRALAQILCSRVLHSEAM